MADQEWVEVGAEEAASPEYGFHRFETVGDRAVGKLVAIKENVQGTYGPETHYIFETPDGKFAINPNSDLKKRLSVVSIGDLLRVTFAATKDIGKPSPLKLFRVEKRGTGSNKAPF